VCDFFYICLHKQALMYEFIEGRPVEVTPTNVVIETAGIGYLIHISLCTYSAIQNGKTGDKGTLRLFLHQVVREDAFVLFGFFSRHEREVFRLLLTVSGVGANTARMILSSLNPDEIRQAIAVSDVRLLSSVKGIGAKTAERIIVDLKNKIGSAQTLSGETGPSTTVTSRDEAIMALTGLGFNKAAVEKVVMKLSAGHPEYSVEELIKQGLRNM